MTIQEAIQRLVNIARNSLDDGQSNHETIEACEKLEEIFRLTLKRRVIVPRVSDKYEFEILGQRRR